METNAKGDGNRLIFQIHNPVFSNWWAGGARASMAENKHNGGTLRGGAVKPGRDRGAEKMDSMWLWRDAKMDDPRESSVVNMRKPIA